jgi:predicted GNAT family N-acyltransferase
MQVRCFPVIDENDMKRCFDIRKEVFVGEQAVPADLEIDRQDDTARHFAVKADGQMVATCRVRFVGSAAKIERVAVLKDYRNKGIGRVLMRYLMTELGKNSQIQLFKLSSQSHAVPFYEKLGFKTRGGEYMDAGIPHYDMVLEK